MFWETEDFWLLPLGGCVSPVWAMVADERPSRAHAKAMLRDVQRFESGIGDLLSGTGTPLLRRATRWVA
jgi:hypothetical protein